MPRRPAVRVQAPQIPDEADTPPFFENLQLLRRQWKWAAFSQFYFTFSQLFNLPDISLNAIEDDLTCGSKLVLPRVMARLLYTLSYDRKVNPTNWQTALRRQYNKRDPALNPIGPEPTVESPSSSSSRESSPESIGAAAGLDSKKVDDRMSVDERDEPVKAKPAEESSEEDRKPENPPDANNNDSTQMVKVEAEEKAKGKGKAEEDEEGLAPPEEESKDWFDLPMLAKLDSLHLLTEWQFHNPTKVRQLMRSEDENAEWRIEPIGYDAKKNSYWLIGADRLWIQRAPPRPPQANKSNKRKSHSTKGFQPSKRPRLGKEGPPRRNKGRSTSRATPLSSQPAEIPGGRRGRAAKLAANAKLDAQAKDLAKLNQEAEAQERVFNGARSSQRLLRGKARASPSSSSTPSIRSRPLGTRVSSRLRGAQDDEWQAIPKEWLAQDGDDESGESDADGMEEEVEEGGKGRMLSPVSNGHKVFEPAPSPSPSPAPPPPVKTGLEDDAVSDLTELTDSEQGSEKEEQDDEDEDSEEEESELSESEVLEEEKPNEFVEWETICVTLYEWEHVADPWVGAKHYLERQLYKTLFKVIAPVILEELREEERQRQMAEAVTQRKRSSRLAMRESEKEQQRQLAKQKLEENERNSRARRAEARNQREQSTREQRETAREQRRREREAREEAEAIAEVERETAKAHEDENVDVVGNIKTSGKSNSRTRGKQQRSLTANGHALNGYPLHGSPTTTRSWELDCEVCRRQGWNVNDGQPVIRCSSCHKYHHLHCLDRLDEQRGVPKRDWRKTSFCCTRCRTQYSAAVPHGGYASPSHQSAYAAYGNAPSRHYDYPSSTTSHRHHHPAYSNGHSTSPMSDMRFQYGSPQHPGAGSLYGQYQHASTSPPQHLHGGYYVPDAHRGAASGGGGSQHGYGGPNGLSSPSDWNVPSSPAAGVYHPSYRTGSVGGGGGAIPEYSSSPSKGYVGSPSPQYEASPYAVAAVAHHGATTTSMGRNGSLGYNGYSQYEQHQHHGSAPYATIPSGLGSANTMTRTRTSHDQRYPAPPIPPLVQPGHHYPHA